MPYYGMIAGLITGHHLAEDIQEKKKAKEKAQAEAVRKALKSQKDQAPRPGSDAHYAAWRAEQMKKKESRE